jgi:hypothetical protein
MSAPSVRKPSPDHPYFYGLRTVEIPSRRGRSGFEDIPLTLEDILHPQLGDTIVEPQQNKLERSHLASVVRSRKLEPSVSLVTADCLIDWGIRGLRPHSPDLAVFVGLRRKPDLQAPIFRLKKSGGRCLMVLEIAAPHTREIDVVRKMDHYHRAGVPLYVIVDQEVPDGSRTLHGYRHGKCGYEWFGLNDRGRLPLDPVGLDLGLRDNDLVCYDAATGREFLDDVAVVRQLEERLRQSRELEQAIEAHRIAAIDREARRTAEEQTRTAQERIRQLEELLRRSQGGTRP